MHNTRFCASIEHAAILLLPGAWLIESSMSNSSDTVKEFTARAGAVLPKPGATEQATSCTVGQQTNTVRYSICNSGQNQEMMREEQ